MATSKSEIIGSYPIGNRLEKFRDLHAACSLRHDPNGSTTGDENESEDGIKNQLFELLLTIQTHPACRLLSSEGRLGPLYTSLPRLNVAVASNFEIECLLPLLKAIRDGEPDEIIWDKVYEAVTESTPPPRLVPSFQQTPWRHNTSSIVDSSEHRTHFDPVLKEELGDLYVDVPGLYEAFFPSIESLESTARAVFDRCSEGEGEAPLYSEGSGWRGFPETTKEGVVLRWFLEKVDKFIHLYEECVPDQKIQRRFLARPNQPIGGSNAVRKLDIGVVESKDDTKLEWSQVLVPGELKNDPKYDKQSYAWLDLGRYVREVITAQDGRRFVHGFTLCGSNMRLWLFDRLGGIASEQFNINNEGLRFVSIILGYLLMTEEQLGFDPTIITGDDGLRYIKINRDGEEERLVIDGVITRRACVAGRATTCRKAYRDGDESKTPLVIKDSWQYPERGEEGELLREALEKGAVNVARYYHHETVRAGDGEDDIRTGVRKGLDITKASNYRSNQSRPPLSRSGSRTARKDGTSSRKRSSTSIEPSLPPSKRQSVSPIKRNINEAIPNRVHRRIVVEDYGKPIFKSSSRVVLLQALEDCIEGYMSLYEKAGLIQSDISPNNLMINEGDGDRACRSFLIDLDLAIPRDRKEPSGARGKTGTRAFMSIGVLLGEQHSFMHDLESFFWVLFWICVHYEGPDKAKVDEDFEKWNFLDMEELAKLKKGEIGDEQDFNSSTMKKFTPYYQPLVPWVNRLRKEVFPDGKRWKKEDQGLPRRMKEILREACADPNVQ